MIELEAVKEREEEVAREVVKKTKELEATKNAEKAAKEKIETEKLQQDFETIKEVENEMLANEMIST
jgi:hypothetical protein